MDTPTNSISLPVEATILPPRMVPGAYVQDNSLNLALDWLESGELDADGFAAIVQGTSNAAAKMLAFRHMLGSRRAARLVRCQEWLGDIQNRLMSQEIQDVIRQSPAMLLAVAKFLRELQEDDTHYIESLTKVSDESAFATIRELAQRRDDSEKQEKVAELAPHKRERLRKLLSSLESKKTP